MPRVTPALMATTQALINVFDVFKLFPLSDSLLIELDENAFAMYLICRNPIRLTF
ncbi:hypothetical protein D3C84_1285110 [compost metagenome]